MAPLRGRNEVRRRRQLLEDAFDRTRLVPQQELRLLSDFAAYLTVLVAGFLETSVQELIIHCARQRSSPQIHGYVESQASRLINVNKDRLLQTVAAFDEAWSQELERSYVVELDAVNSLYAHRHRIAHGDPVQVTIVTVRDQYEKIWRLIDKLSDFFDPAS